MQGAISIQYKVIRMKKPAESFKDLIVWQKAHALVLEVYKLTANFPKEEVYGLTSQLRRSAVSVPANIAEGFKRKGQADKLRFYNIAQASLEETRYFLILAQDLKYGNSKSLEDQAEEVSKILNGLIKSITATRPKY